MDIQAIKDNTKVPWNEIDLKVFHILADEIARLKELEKKYEYCMLKIASKYELTEQEQVKRSGRY